ncbi:MAG: type IV secretion system protein TraC [Nitrosomonas sp.]|uniref:Conjugal transfer ATP-binding protein TraC n=1 Tax=Nitrosomonas aestuarii TaxID=52441 RepID=A0A1I4DMU4_9PROT|nr:type IV secretion system protein TraC [Nitrosomonas aestuarii]MBX3630298.1 type IV secretion system protein TraC [Nitrosomonas sp.]SFK93647.1 conjugal transfer ATP-binding protein TraC [Nitrosomonas aestuarii]
MSILQNLKTVFNGERFDPADAVPVNLLREFASIPRLTGMLPYLAWLPDEELFVLDQGDFGQKLGKSLGFCIETAPQTGANPEMERVLSSLFLSCPVGTGIQISLYASPHILPRLRDQANMLPESQEARGLRHKNIFRELARRRIGYYLNGTGQSLFNDQTFLLRDYRCVLSFTLPLDPESAADVEEAVRIRESVHATLRSAYLSGDNWKPDQLLNFVADFFDHERAMIRTPIFPIEYDDTRILRDQVSTMEIASAVADNCIKFRKNGALDTALQCFSVRRYPRSFRLSNMESLIGDYFRTALAMPCPYLITMGAVVQDYETAKTRCMMKAARATQAAGSYMARFQPDLQDRKHDWDRVLMSLSNGSSIVQMYHQIVLVSEFKNAARCAHAVQAVWQARGFDLTRDIYLQHHAMTAAMPCTLTPAFQADLRMFGRLNTKTSDNAVMTSPFLAEWKGTRTPVLTLFGRRGQIMGFDLFDNRSGNYNFAVSALSGAGKSVFVNELVFRYLGRGAKIWIIDIGRSYMHLCELLDGEFITFSDERQNKLCLNPFSMVQDINNDMEMLLPMIARMASPQAELDNFCYSALSTAIKRVWDNKGKKATITDIFELLRTGKLSEDGGHERDLQRLAVALEPYTRHGVYASYFEGDANIHFQKDLVVLELEELNGKKSLQAVVMQLMLYFISQEMYRHRDRVKIAVFDEAWDLIREGASAHFIEAGYRKARKYRGAFGSITQSVEDYYKNETTRAMIENADWLFLLRQKPESIERLGKEGKLSIDGYLKRQMTSVTTELNRYSEIFIHSPAGSGVGRLVLDPFSMLLYSTTPEDFEAIKQLTDTGVPLVEAIEQLLQRKAQ